MKQFLSLLQRKKTLVVVFIFTASSFLFINISIVKARTFPSQCEVEGYIFVPDDLDRPKGYCCKEKSTFEDHSLTWNGECEIIASEGIELSVTNVFDGRCYYRIRREEYNGRLQKKGHEGIECSEEWVYLYNMGDLPNCRSDQCRWGSIINGLVCYNTGEQVPLRNWYCCLGRDTSSCSNPPWCKDGCPIALDPENGEDPVGGHTEIKRLTCEEACTDSDGNLIPECCACVCSNSPNTPNPNLSCECVYDRDSNGDLLEPVDAICHYEMGSQNVWTGFGCIDSSEKGLIIFAMRLFVGVISALAVVRFIQAGMMMNTDDPEKIKEGKGIAISAVIALVIGGLIPLILNFVGLDILGIGKIYNLVV